MGPLELAESSDPADGPIVKMVDRIMRELLRVSPARLEARWSDPGRDVDWTITHRAGDVLWEASLPEKHFRACLARFGFHYLSEQFYGGYAHRRISFRGQVHPCSFFVSNAHLSGFWVRVYAGEPK